jgi:hypothetical protein
MYRVNKSKIKQSVSRFQVPTPVNVHVVVVDSSVSEENTDYMSRKEAKLEELVFSC